MGGLVAEARHRELVETLVTVPVTYVRHPFTFYKSRIFSHIDARTLVVYQTRIGNSQFRGTVQVNTLPRITQGDIGHIIEVDPIWRAGAGVWLIARSGGPRPCITKKAPLAERSST